MTANREIEILAQQLPEVFDQEEVPADWDEPWAFISIDDPDVQFQENDPVSIMGSDAVIEGGAITADRLSSYFSGTFPGSLRLNFDRDFYPPPDAFAFYLPFHFFYPTWWGIYLLDEGVREFAKILSELSNGQLSSEQCFQPAKVFLFGHEQFHHEVESFATRLEVTHRIPIYRDAFEQEYMHYLGTDECIEEALANANGLRRVHRVLARDGSLPALQKAFETYIPMTPPGYRLGLEFFGKRRFEQGRNRLAERYHQGVHSVRRELDPIVWESFPRAFHPFRSRNSRVNYLIHRDSLISGRGGLPGQCFRFREVVQQLEKVAGCKYLATKGSHVQFRAPNGAKVTVPRHPGDLKIRTLASIVRQTGVGMNVEQFMRA